MYLQKHLVIVALAVGLLCQLRITEGTLKKEIPNGFTYYWEVIHTSRVPKDGPISSFVLAAYAASRYREMVATGNSVMPGAMSALWLPATQEIIFASSAKGGPEAGFAYHPGNIPIELEVDLAYAAAQGTRDGGWLTDIHNKGGACGEIVAMSRFYARYPGSKRIPGSPDTKFVTVGQHGNQYGPIVVFDACEGTVSGPGCRDFLIQLGLSYCQRSEVSGALRKRQGLSQANGLERRQDDDDDEAMIDLLNFVFDCYKAWKVENDDTLPTTITTLSPAMETSFALESNTATALPTLGPGDFGPGDSDVQLDIPSSTAVDDNDDMATTLVPVESPSPDPANPQIAPGSGKPGGNAPDNSPKNPADGSGTNTNPQDPYANSGPGIVNPPKLFIRSVSD